MIGALLGLIIGSFIATLVLRAGEGRSVGGRSACDGCGKPLAPWNLIPLVSWMVQRGRCRHCDQSIDPLHPLTESLAAVVGGTALYLSPDPAGAALMLFGWLLLALALFDARHFWLPHWLSALTALMGWLLGGEAMQSVGLFVPLIDRLLGTVAGFAVLWLIGSAYLALRGRQGLGGGDAPMFAAMGAWMGWTALPLVLLFAALAGLAIALIRLTVVPHGEADWRTMRLPLGTLLALAAGPALALLHASLA